MCSSLETIYILQRYRSEAGDRARRGRILGGDQLVIGDRVDAGLDLRNQDEVSDSSSTRNSTTLVATSASSPVVDRLRFQWFSGLPGRSLDVARRAGASQSSAYWLPGGEENSISLSRSDLQQNATWAIFTGSSRYRSGPADAISACPVELDFIEQFLSNR